MRGFTYSELLDMTDKERVEWVDICQEWNQEVQRQMDAAGK